ncbi:hypothetical protein U91I_03375 [alpha proteobacterium U9-1i]|nr:hypothetical protein U91I_03375 [alpha proteobacterium U9-1i]
MSEFDALLKRSFAEAHEPADDGFTVAVTHRVAKREKAAQARFGMQMAGLGVGLAAVSYGLYALASVLGPEVAATAGLELARVHGAMSGGPSVSFTDVVQSLGAGLSQVLLVTAAVAAGAVAFRNAQD